MLSTACRQVASFRPLLQVAQYASASDYSLVMEQASALAEGATAPNGDLGMTAGIPLETMKRKVRIFSPARTAGQQGIGKTIENAAAPAWRMAFSTEEKWINPLMGWTSTADPLENVARASLAFFTKEQAIAFANKNGWEYEVAEPNQRRTTRQRRYAGYGDNFSIKRKGLPDLSNFETHAKILQAAGAAAAARK